MSRRHRSRARLHPEELRLALGAAVILIIIVLDRSGVDPQDIGCILFGGGLFIAVGAGSRIALPSWAAMTA